MQYSDIIFIKIFKRKIIITKDRIKKSFLFIISPPFKKRGNHLTIKCSKKDFFVKAINIF